MGSLVLISLYLWVSLRGLDGFDDLRWILWVGSFPFVLTCSGTLACVSSFGLIHSVWFVWFGSFGLVRLVRFVYVGSFGLFLLYSFVWFRWFWSIGVG